MKHQIIKELKSVQIPSKTFDIINEEIDIIMNNNAEIFHI